MNGMLAGVATITRSPRPVRHGGDHPRDVAPPRGAAQRRPRDDRERTGKSASHKELAHLPWSLPAASRRALVAPVAQAAFRSISMKRNAGRGGRRASQRQIALRVALPSRFGATAGRVAPHRKQPQ